MTRFISGRTPTTNAEAFERALVVTPGGVNSPVRAFRSVGGTPVFLASGHGPYVVDVEGTEYVDLVGQWGPALLGHAHPDVIAAAHEAVARGLGFGASSTGEVELAELVLDRLTLGEGASERRGIEKLRLVSTGTEATMTAIRLARGATGRPLLVKFAGHYHGHSDSLLSEAGSGIATLGIPGSAGITPETAAQTIVIPYNDEDALAEVFALHGDRIAAIITEAAAANMGVVPPKPGFNRLLGETARAHGALLIVDEVMTGFRSTAAGWWGLEEAAGSGYDADLTTFGKIIGGGLPLAGLGGRAEILDLLAPLGPVYQAGTLSGNPVAVATGAAMLRGAGPEVYDRLPRTARTIADGLSAALSAEGVAHTVAWAGSQFSIFFRPDAPQNYAEAQDQHTWRFGAYFHAMLEHGVSLPPSVYEAWFVSAAHDDAAIERVLAAAGPAAKAAAAATPAL
ncbi:glutamate-1-semialdehyde 2,1-aminomutase [Microcella daejeonensis]|jgi:glutamate-1-semialdehyde 2,1-aminomutase|uniref:Glutamate-1-semialdehyde 2,1-aminomutase n=1 Tax=Microcella daejeonensis TaxID=2994971 RepID=A0A9E8MMU6_9MICO|nr:glutamate-1-semialdehyde 2,1-aminomutase [Microcella daejeonensis]WAB82398.1 glutamate-1-semialdehyde 2,1-aminomutase [Microcella daejeonensis]